MPEDSEEVEDEPGEAVMPEPGGIASSAANPLASPSTAVAKSMRRVRKPPPPLPEHDPNDKIEELIITPRSLTGYWRLVAAHSIDVEIGLFSGVRIHYGGEPRDRNICWLEQSLRKLTVQCASGVALKSGAGSVEEDAVSMRWWMGPATIIFSGKVTPQKIAGGFSGGVAGLSVTGDVPASLVRVDLPEQIPPEPPSGAVLRAVWQDVHDGKLSEKTYDGLALRRIKDGVAPELVKDPPKSLRLLGQILIRWRKEQRETVQDVYQVDTETGRKLCRIALSERGTALDVNCSALPALKP